MKREWIDKIQTVITIGSAVVMFVGGIALSAAVAAQDAALANALATYGCIGFFAGLLGMVTGMIEI